MWLNITHGNPLITNLHSSASTYAARPRSQLMKPEEAAKAQSRLKTYEKYLINIRHQRHLERVAKTKFLSKLLKKTGHEGQSQQR